MAKSKNGFLFRTTVKYYRGVAYKYHHVDGYFELGVFTFDKEIDVINHIDKQLEKENF